MRVTRLVRIEGDNVPVLVDRVTVSQLREIGDAGYPRGVSLGDPDHVYLSRCQLIDTFTRPAPCAIKVDGVAAIVPLAATFGAQPQVVADLYDALVSAQHVSEDERTALEVSARFAWWLADAKERDSSSPWAETGTSCAKCHALDLCGKRGCDGTPKPKPVWHDGRMAVKVCPVRSFTPEIEATLRLFFWSHELRQTGWTRVCLPADGGLDDQTAWTMGALGVLQTVHNRLTEAARAKAE